MLYSMTGFGKRVVETSRKKITIEIKSLNSKQMDVAMRVPSVFREAELEMRSVIAQKLQRGKVDVTVSVECRDGAAPVQLNVTALKAYRDQVKELASTLDIAEPTDWYSVLLRLPDVTRTDTDDTPDLDERAALFEALDGAIAGLIDFRHTEGAKLEAFFTERVERIAALLGEVAPYETERVAKIRHRIEENLASLSLAGIDTARLEQEMIFYIEKLDINEEKQRLNSHLHYFLETMKAPAGQGKKLGFIAQEMGREINTLGSKSNHAQLQRIVVKMKDELEQIKEQVLNVL